MKTQGYYLLITIAQSFVSTFIASVAGVVVYLSVIMDGLVEPEIINGQFGLFILGVLNALSCFFIVRHNSVSIWFVPLLINIFVIAIAFWEPDFWSSTLWIPACGGWILCIVASLLGLRKGNKVVWSPLKL